MPRLFERLRSRLKRMPLSASGAEGFDPEELETQLLLADVGPGASAEIVAAAANAARGGHEIGAAVRDELERLLAPAARPLVLDAAARPYVILVLGVNGSGKTTTIAKLARRLRGEGKSVMLAACDTFRAAAIEQLEQWGRRTDVPVVAQRSGADPAAVAFDAWQAARARGSDVLIVDTAGRLHTQDHLVAELQKVRRVLARQDAAAPHETLLVLDGTTGQNALAQARRFAATVGVTGLVITKLDGSAKGGAVVAITRELGLPIRFLGLGEQAEDLEPFDAHEFASALAGIEP